MKKEESIFVLHLNLNTMRLLARKQMGLRSKKKRHVIKACKKYAKAIQLMIKFYEKYYI